jgi:hypothetical protein
MDGDDRPPICPRCGVTMVPAALSAGDEHEVDTLEGPCRMSPTAADGKAAAFDASRSKGSFRNAGQASTRPS